MLVTELWFIDLYTKENLGKKSVLNILGMKASPKSGH